MLLGFSWLRAGTEGTHSSSEEYETTVPDPPTFAAIEPYLKSPRPVLQSPSETTMRTSQSSERVISPTTLSTSDSANHPPGFMINSMTATVQNQQSSLLQRERNDDSLSDNVNDISPSTQLSLVDVRFQLAHEKSRRDTFKKYNLETFVDVPIECLAYCGFYLNGEGTALLCPCCEVRLTVNEFKYHMEHGAEGSDSEPWTPMRVHRHASGQLIDQTRP
ncbi:unnamed protein product, partial [Didymodactylos carnosus]